MSSGWVKVRKKPVAVKALSVEKQNLDLIRKLPSLMELNTEGRISGKIRTLEGYHEFSENDLIIEGVRGEHYPIKRSIFADTYDSS